MVSKLVNYNVYTFRMEAGHKKIVPKTYTKCCQLGTAPSQSTNDNLHKNNPNQTNTL